MDARAQESCMARVEEQPCAARVEEWLCMVHMEEWLCVVHMEDIAWANAITEARGTAPGDTTGAADGTPMA
jgi:hypothetical protein